LVLKVILPPHSGHGCDFFCVGLAMTYFSLREMTR
jgi:hypothetical protein